MSPVGAGNTPSFPRRRESRGSEHRRLSLAEIYGAFNAFVFQGLSFDALDSRLRGNDGEGGNDDLYDSYFPSCASKAARMSCSSLTRKTASPNERPLIKNMSSTRSPSVVILAVCRRT